MNISEALAPRPAEYNKSKPSEPAARDERRGRDFAQDFDAEGDAAEIDRTGPNDPQTETADATAAQADAPKRAHQQPSEADRFATGEDTKAPSEAPRAADLEQEAETPFAAPETTGDVETQPKPGSASENAPTQNLAPTTGGANAGSANVETGAGTEEPTAVNAEARNAERAPVLTPQRPARPFATEDAPTTTEPASKKTATDAAAIEGGAPPAAAAKKPATDPNEATPVRAANPIAENAQSAQVATLRPEAQAAEPRPNADPEPRPDAPKRVGAEASAATPSPTTLSAATDDPNAESQAAKPGLPAEAAAQPQSEPRAASAPEPEPEIEARRGLENGPERSTTHGHADAASELAKRAVQGPTSAPAAPFGAEATTGLEFNPTAPSSGAERAAPTGPAPAAPAAQAAAAPVVAQVAVAASGRNQDGTVEIRLDPPELGRVRLEMRFDGPDHVTVVVQAERSDTLDLMRRHAELLERELTEAGLSLDTLEFSADGDFSDGFMADGDPEQTDASAENNAAIAVKPIDDRLARAAIGAAPVGPASKGVDLRI